MSQTAIALTPEQKELVISEYNLAPLTQLHEVYPDTMYQVIDERTGVNGSRKYVNNERRVMGRDLEWVGRFVHADQTRELEIDMYQHSETHEYFTFDGVSLWVF